MFIFVTYSFQSSLSCVYFCDIFLSVCLVAKIVAVVIGPNCKANCGYFFLIVKYGSDECVLILLTVV